MNSVPYNNEAEQSLIGSVFLDNRVLLDTIDKIYPEDFYQMRHQIYIARYLNYMKKVSQLILQP